MTTSPTSTPAPTPRPAPTPVAAGVSRPLELFAWSLVFFAAYTYRPLFTSNQVTKFLHGLALAGYGFLKDDWLATTFDTFPLFTRLVQAIQLIHPWGFILAMIPICMVYLAGLLGLARVIGLRTEDWRQRSAFLTLVILSHSALAVQLIKLATGFEEKGFPGGLAEQYLLGPIFQPNVFGVFIVLSLAVFAAGRPVVAAGLLAVAPVMHPTYLIGTGIVLAVYLGALIARKRWAAATVGAAVFLLPIVPLLAFVSSNLSPTDPETYARANEILAHSRIEHHSVPRFLEPITIGKGLVCLLAVVLSWRNAIGWTLIAGLAVGGGLTAVTVATGSDTLALIAPWRVSVWIVPIAVGVVLAAAVTWALAGRRGERLRRWVAPGCGVVLAVCLAAGVAVQVSIYRGFEALPWIDAMRHVRETKRAGDHYLVPPDVAEFRVQAGVPTLVTWKSHPIKDVEVLAWHERVVAAEAFYAARGEEKLARLREVVEGYHVTHVLVPAEQLSEVRGGGAVVYEDAHYAVVRVHSR